MNDHYNQLLDYIQQHLQHGTPPETIRQSLVQAGWDSGMVNHALHSLLYPVSPQAPQVQQANPQPEKYNGTNAFSPAPQITQPASYPIESPGAATQATGNPVGLQQKYKVFRGFADSFDAMKNNFPVFIGATVSASLIGGAMFMGVIFLASLLLPSVIGNFSGFVVFASFLLPILLAPLALLVASSFIITVISLTLADGHNLHESSYTGVLGAALKKIGRVLGVNLLLYTIVIGPFIGMLLLAIILDLLNMGPLSTIISITSVLDITVWMIIVVLRYATAPFVAIFEPHVPITKTLSRSFYLVKKGGQWYTAKLIGIMFLLVIILSAVSGEAIRDLSESPNPFVSLSTAIITVFFEAVLLMLYLNRKAVKG